MTALRRRLSATKPAKRKSSRKVATTKVSSKAKALGKKSTSKATGKGPPQAKDSRRYSATSFAGGQHKPLKHAPLSKARPTRGVGLERLARLVAHASRALGTNAEAREFIETPHPMLGGVSPLHAAKTDLGVSRVENILHALEYGLAL
jgi:putative toxin-antitoxin system antitoxin component (TIGR02293 family)